MNVSVKTENEKRYYFNAQRLSVQDGNKLIFRGKHWNNAVEIPLSDKHVEIEIKIKDKKKVEY